MPFSQHHLLPHLNVATLQCQAETGLLILDKVQGHLWVALFLQVGNDGLAHKLSIPHHVQHLQRKGPGTEAVNNFLYPQVCVKEECRVSYISSPHHTFC